MKPATYQNWQAAIVILRAHVTLSRWGWLTEQRHFTVTISRTFHWFDKLWTKLTFDDPWMDNVISKPKLKVFLPQVYNVSFKAQNISKVTFWFFKTSFAGYQPGRVTNQEEKLLCTRVICFLNRHLYRHPEYVYVNKWIVINKGLRALRAKIQKLLFIANCIAFFLMQVYKIKVKKVTRVPFRKYLGSKLNAASAF